MTGSDLADDLADDDHLAEQVDQLRQVRTLVNQMNGVLAGPANTHTTTVRGRSAIARSYAEICAEARVEIRQCYRSPVLEPDAEVEPDLATPRGIRHRNLIDTAAMAVAGFPEIVLRWGRIPEVEQRIQAYIPFTMMLADDRRAILGLTGDDGAEEAVILSPSLLLDALTNCFESLWAMATPLNVVKDTGEVAGMPPDEDRGIVALLAAGETDSAIGRQMSLSKRTVQRRVARVMDDLRARSRFQAGMNAAKRGWI